METIMTETNYIVENHPREAKILKNMIIPEVYKYMLNNHGFVGGGAVRAVFTSDHIGDIDIFFERKEDFNKDGELENGLKVNSDYNIMFSKTDVAWTHKPDYPDYAKYPLQQMICAVYGKPEEVIGKFDFTMCMASWIPDTDKFVMDKYFLKHCAQKRLHFNVNADYPICSMWRAAKFIKRGWKLPAIDCIKLALKINNISIQDKGELKRQLMGIDTIFLKELTDALEKDHSGRYDFGEAIDFLEKIMPSEDA